MVEGDLLALIDVAHTSATTMEAAPALPDWDLVDSFTGVTQNDVNTNGRTRLTLYTRPWVAGVPAPTVPFDNSDATSAHYSRIHGMRGVLLSDPTDVLGVATVSAPSGDVIAGIKGVNVNHDGGFVMVIAACGNNHSAAGESNASNLLTGEGLAWFKMDEFTYTTGLDMSMIVQAAQVPTATPIADKNIGIFSGIVTAVTRMWSFNPVTAVPPAEVLNIGSGPAQNHVKLQMARPGDPAITTVSMADLAAGFSEAPYFHTTADGLRVHTEARLDAPTTSGSTSSRCELREVDAAGADYSWDPATGEHDMRGTTTITALPPTKPEVVIAQIFNETGSADLASIRTQLVSGTVRLRFRYQGVSVTSPQLASPYAVGTEFAWRIRVVGGVIEVYWAFGGAALPATPQITTAAVPTGVLCYFKAGLYNQSNVAAGDAGTAIGASELRALTITHTGSSDPRLTPLFGLDVNRFRAGLNLATAQNEGLSFVFGKIGQGASTGSGFGQTLDESWPTFRDAAKAIGMPLGGYWYLGDTETPESQAARCRAWIGDRGIPIALDWEEGGGEWSNVLACITAFRAAGLTVRILYTRATWHGAHGGGDIGAQGLALWNARYPTTSGGTPTALYDNVKTALDTYWQTYGGVSAEFLQYSDASTIAGTSPVDANAYDGTEAELATLLAPVAQPAPSPRVRGAFAPFFPDRVRV